MDENQHAMARGSPWGPWATAGFSLIITAVYIATGIITTLSIAAYDSLIDPQDRLLANTDDLDHDGFLLSIASIATAAICTGLILLFVAMRSRITITEYLLLKRVPVKVLLRWIGIALVIAFGWDGINLLIGRPIVPEFMRRAYATAGFIPLFWIALVFAAPLLEELFFRGFLFSGLEHSWLKLSGTIAVTAVIWAIIHVQYGFWDIFWICIMGILFGIARVRTGSIYTPMALHMILNLVATLETAYYVAAHGAGL